MRSWGSTGGRRGQAELRSETEPMTLGWNLRLVLDSND